MSLRFTYTKTAKVERLLTDGSDMVGYVDHINNLPCHIQPATGSMAQDVEGSFGKDWFMICDMADIIEGDRVTINNKTYRVVAVEQHSFLDHTHTECTLRIFEG